MRFVKNQTLSDCGPVAVLNILKWAGWKLTYKDHIRHLKEICDYKNTDEFVGVRWPMIKKALNTLSNNTLRVKKHEVCNLKTLERHLVNGGAFILRHRISSRDHHYSVIVPSGAADLRFSWINAGKKTVRKISPKDFEKEVMSTQQFDDGIIALLISKA